jgi:hypothetical protein
VTRGRSYGKEPQSAAKTTEAGRDGWPGPRPTVRTASANAAGHDRITGITLMRVPAHRHLLPAGLRRVRRDLDDEVGVSSDGDTVERGDGGDVAQVSRVHKSCRMMQLAQLRSLASSSRTCGGACADGMCAADTYACRIGQVAQRPGRSGGHLMQVSRALKSAGNGSGSRSGEYAVPFSGWTAARPPPDFRRLESEGRARTVVGYCA